MALTFRFEARSDIGLTRSNNQDSAYAGPNLLVVADGMGGHAGGDTASSVAISHLAPLDSEAPSADEAADQLSAAVEDAHQELLDIVAEDPALAGLGTTITALLRSGDRVVLGHIGDSRAYLLRDGEFEQITTDHTFVQYLVQTGKIEPEQAEHHPQRSLLLRVLGDVELGEGLDISVRELCEGDRFLLCSDGLSGVVGADTMRRVLLEEKDPGTCADRLIDLALRGGAPDNVTVIIGDALDIDHLGDGQAPATASQIVGAAEQGDHHPRKRSSSPAERAAELTSAPQDMTLKDERKPTYVGHRLRWVIGLACLVVALAAASFFGYRWTQTQYYVAESNGNVAIYRGIPQTIGPLHLSHVEERTNIRVADLPSVNRDRLKETITAASYSEAQSKLAGIVADAAARSTRSNRPPSISTPSPNVSSPRTQ